MNGNLRFYSKIIVEIITNIAPGRLTQSKMICIKDLVDSKLFKIPECRQILLPVFCKQIKDKLESKEEVCAVTLRLSFFLYGVCSQQLFCVIHSYLVTDVFFWNHSKRKSYDMSTLVT